MKGTDLCVKSRNAQQLCDLERVKPQPSPSLLLGLEPVQSCLGVARVMSNYGFKKNQSRSYLNHLVHGVFSVLRVITQLFLRRKMVERDIIVNCNWIDTRWQ